MRFDIYHRVLGENKKSFADLRVPKHDSILRISCDDRENMQNFTIIAYRFNLVSTFQVLLLTHWKNGISYWHYRHMPYFDMFDCCCWASRICIEYEILASNKLKPNIILDLIWCIKSIIFWTLNYSQITAAPFIQIENSFKQWSFHSMWMLWAKFGFFFKPERLCENMLRIPTKFIEVKCIHSYELAEFRSSVKFSMVWEIFSLHLFSFLAKMTGGLQFTLMLLSMKIWLKNRFE